MRTKIGFNLQNIIQKGLFFFFLMPLTLVAFEPRPVTPYPVVGYRELSFFDNFQKVDRQILVWYPVAAQVTGSPSKNPWDIFNIALNAPPAQTQVKMPVIALSHGYTGNPHQLSWLIRSFVNNGFIVLGIQHRDLIDGRSQVNHWERALDIKTLLDQFFASPMASFAQPNQVGIAGYSLGGTTAIWIAGGRTTRLSGLVQGSEFAALLGFDPAGENLLDLNKEMMSKDWRDERVKAAFVMAPAWAWLFDEASLQKISIPLYLIAAAQDETVLTSNNAGVFARAIPNAFYQTIPGKADHFIFISALTDKQSKAVDPSGRLNFLFANNVSIDRAWIQFQVADQAVQFFKASFADSDSQKRDKNLPPSSDR